MSKISCENDYGVKGNEPVDIALRNIRRRLAEKDYNVRRKLDMIAVEQSKSMVKYDIILFLVGMAFGVFVGLAIGVNI